MTGPIPYFLSILSKWPTTIPPETQWFVYFDLKSVGVLKGRTSEIINTIDSQSSDVGSIYQGVIDDLISDPNQAFTDNNSGCVFARQITVPGESVNASNEGLDYAGWQAPATIGTRKSYERFTTYFMETNSSFVDYVIRPWLIATSHYGFIARSDKSKNVKCKQVQAIYLGKSGPFTTPYRRKVITFHNVAPISMRGLTNTQASDGMQVSSVDFIYDYYTIESADAGALVGY